MPAARAFAAVALIATAVAVCGCGAGARTPAVLITLTAPVDGARVAVPGILVVGTVTPSRASLRIGGRPVAVRAGAFTLPVTLRAHLTHITVSAGARGYRPAQTDLLVTYEPRRAAPAAAAAPRGRSVAEQMVDGAFLSTCDGAGTLSACVCAWHYLIAHGVVTPSQWQALSLAVKIWLTGGRLGGPPPVLAGALRGCRARLS